MCSQRKRAEYATDRVLMGEAISTIAAALDTAVRASSPSTSLDSALEFRRIGRSQCDVVARLLSHLRASAAKMEREQGAAADPGQAFLAGVAAP